MPDLLIGLGVGLFVAVIVGWAVVTPLHCFLRSFVPPPKEENKGKSIPSWLTGMFERFIFACFIFVFPSPTVITAMMAWLALKMAAVWNRGGRQEETPAEKEFWGRHSFIAVLSGLASMTFAWAGGMLARLFMGLDAGTQLTPPAAAAPSAPLVQTSVDAFQWFSTFLDFGTHLLWPAVVLIGLCMFRGKIAEASGGFLKSLAHRSIKATVPGGSIDLGATDQRSAPSAEALKSANNTVTANTVIAGTSSTPGDASRPAPEHPNPAMRPVIAKYEAQIREEVDQFVRAFGTSRDAALVRIAAGWRMTAVYEIIYRTVYGSQLLAVTTLKERGGVGQVADLKPFYDKAARDNPGTYAAYPFEAWVRYMADWGLITVVSENVSVGPEGGSILAYLTQRNYPLFKPN